MQYEFQSYIDRRNTNSIKWDCMNLKTPYSDNTTLPLWIADMDISCPPVVIQNLHDRVDKKIFGYSHYKTGEYFRSVIGWYLYNFDWYINSDDIFYSPGVVPSLSYLIEILTEEGDGIIIQPPVYNPFENVINSTKRTVSKNNLINENGYYTIDFKDLEEKAKQTNNKVLLICHPHNPVGRVWTKDELKEISRICEENGLYIRVLSKLINEFEKIKTFTR